MRKELVGFQVHLARIGLRQSTIALHTRCLDRIFDEAPNLTLTQIESFLQRMLSSGRKATYVNFFVDSLRVFGRYIHNEYCSTIKPFPEEEPVISTMSDEDIETFLKLPPPSYTFIHRSGKKVHRTFAKGYDSWTLFYSIFAYTGMRPGEIAHLTINDVDFGQSVLVVRSEVSKTHDPRRVPIPPQIFDKLHTYVDRVKDLYLFPSLRKGKQKGPVVDNVDWHYNFHARLKRMGLKRTNVKPYSLRHSFITRMLDEEDVNLFNVQKIVGHRRLDTTLHYYHYTTKAIQKTIRKDPLARLSITPQEKNGRMADTIRGFHLELDPRYEWSLEEREDEINFHAKIKVVP